jgi:hypothetical protein
MASLFAQGNAITADKLNGAYTAYSVVWSTTGSAPAIGNGSVSGAWQRLGDVMFVLVVLQWGTTTTSGTGAFKFSLPLAASTTGSTPHDSGYGWGIDQGVAYYQGTIQLYDSTHLIVSNSAGAWGATAPFTWGNTDELVACGWFPIG